MIKTHAWVLNGRRLLNTGICLVFCSLGAECSTKNSIDSQNISLKPANQNASPTVGADSFGKGAPSSTAFSPNCCREEKKVIDSLLGVIDKFKLSSEILDYFPNWYLGNPSVENAEYIQNRIVQIRRQFKSSSDEFLLTGFIDELENAIKKVLLYYKFKALLKYPVPRIHSGYLKKELSDSYYHVGVPYEVFTKDTLPLELYVAYNDFVCIAKGTKDYSLFIQRIKKEPLFMLGTECCDERLLKNPLDTILGRSVLMAILKMKSNDQEILFNSEIGIDILSVISSGILFKAWAITVKEPNLVTKNDSIVYAAAIKFIELPEVAAFLKLYKKIGMKTQSIKQNFEIYSNGIDSLLKERNAQ